MSKEAPQLASDKLWIGNLDNRITEFQLLNILKKYGEIDYYNFVYHTAGPNIGQSKGFAFVRFKEAEDTINVLTNLSNKKIGGKHVAVRYAKHMDPEENAKGSKNLPSLGAASSSKASLADKKSKIQLIEEQLKNLQKQSDDFELNNEKTLTEPLIKKYQFNKDAKPTTSSRHQSYYKKKRKPY